MNSLSLAAFVAALSVVSMPDSESTSVTAIDVLLLPDQTMIDRANAANAELRKNYPAGFALDATHRPHISLLHRYVRTADLDAVYDALDQVFDRERPVGWRLEGTGYFHVVFNGLGLPGIVVRPTPELLQLQQEVIAAVEPWQAICQAAERLGADLVCLGTHGRTGIARAALGSVAVNVLTHIRRPLLLARGQKP